MKKIFLAIISFLLGTVLFVWALNYIGWQELRQIFLKFSLAEGLIILCLAVLARSLEVLRWQEILKNKGQRFSFLELAGPTLACFAIYYLVPMAFTAADLFRSHVLKKKSRISAEKRISSVLIDRLSTVFPIATAVTLGFFFFLIKTNLPLIVVFRIFLGFGVFVAVVWFFRVRIGEEKSFLKIFIKLDENNLASKVEQEVFAFFKRKNPVAYKVFALSFLKVLIEMGQAWLLVLFLSQSLAFPQLMAVFGLSQGAMEIPVTADLGSHDWAVVLVFQELGLGKGLGMVFASVLRGVNIFFLILGLWFLFKLSFGIMGENFLKKFDKLIGNHKNNYEK